MQKLIMILGLTTCLWAQKSSEIEYGKAFVVEDIPQYEEVVFLGISTLVDNNLVDMQSYQLQYQRGFSNFYRYGGELKFNSTDLSATGAQLERDLAQVGTRQSVNQPSTSAFATIGAHPIFGKVNFLNMAQTSMFLDFDLGLGATRYSEGNTEGKDLVPSYFLESGIRFAMYKASMAKLSIRRTTDNFNGDRSFSYTEMALKVGWSF